MGHYRNNIMLYSQRRSFNNELIKCQLKSDDIAVYSIESHSIRKAEFLSLTLLIFS